MNKDTSAKVAKSTQARTLLRTSKKKKKVRSRKSKSTPKAALQTLKNGSASSKKSKKLKTPKQKKPVGDVEMTPVREHKATPKKSAAHKQKSTKEINKFGLFVGGLNFESRRDSILQHFSQFGTVLKCTIRRDRREKALNKSYGFVYLDSQEAINKALAAEHMLDSSTLIVAKKINEGLYKFGLLVRGLNYDSSEDSISQHFSQFGTVLKCIIPCDRKEKDLNKGFGFVYLDSQEAIAKALIAEHTLDSSTLVVTKKKNERIYNFGLLVEGLNFNSRGDSISQHFSQFGTVLKCIIPCNRNEKGLNKGFGFVYLDSRKAIAKALAAEHTLDSSTLIITKKKTEGFYKFGLLVEGLKFDTSEDSISHHFSQFGTVFNCIIPCDRKEKGLNKGFGFVYLDSQEAIDKALAAEHTLDSSTLIVTKKKSEGAAGKRKRDDSNQSEGDEKRQITTSDTELFEARIKYSTSKDTVMEPSSQFGDVASVDLPMIPNSSENKCFAFGTCKAATSLQKDIADSDREKSEDNGATSKKVNAALAAS